MKMNNINYIQALKNAAKFHKVHEMVYPVLEDDRFAHWSGSGKDVHHHYGDGGLLRHTLEVVDFCQVIVEQHNGNCTDNNNRINHKELFISAVWHDYGKIWDYQKVDGVWGKHDSHARQIHHITRSAMEFEKHYDCNTLPECNKDNIIHNILSHHGCREYGSPVSPATREAWVLHLADNLSARLDDCNKHDRFSS